MVFIESMRKEARKSPGEIAFRVVCGWTFGLSLQLGEWHFSAELFPKGRSSIDNDWHYLGRVLKKVGAPEQPITPFETTPPNAVHHWHWAVG